MRTTAAAAHRAACIYEGAGYQIRCACGHATDWWPARRTADAYQALHEAHPDWNTK